MRARVHGHGRAFYVKLLVRGRVARLSHRLGKLQQAVRLTISPTARTLSDPLLVAVRCRTPRTASTRHRATHCRCTAGLTCWRYAHRFCGAEQQPRLTCRRTQAARHSPRSFPWRPHPFSRIELTAHLVRHVSAEPSRFRRAPALYVREGLSMAHSRHWAALSLIPVRLSAEIQPKTCVPIAPKRSFGPAASAR